MNRAHLQYVAGAIALASALLLGWHVTSILQDSTSSETSAYAACWKLEGTSRQVDCLADGFVAGARSATSGKPDHEREGAIIAFVRAQEARAADDASLAGICHPAMHVLGQNEGRRAARLDSVPTFPEASTQLCTAGYVHGLAEGYLVGTPAADVRTVFTQLCHDPDARTGCAHGVGHALLRARTDERPIQAAAAATRRCTELPGTFGANCMNGVYMELAMRVRPAKVEPDAYVAACHRVANVDAQLACWSYLGLNLTTNDVPLAQVPEWCAKASLPGQFTCIEEYGRDLGVAGVAGCERLEVRSELQQRCVDGAIGLQVGSGHVSRQEARSTCSNLGTVALARYCRAAADRYARGHSAVEA
jgi:hypothetical protein